MDVMQHEYYKCTHISDVKHQEGDQSGEAWEHGTIILNSKRV
jgi:hypothetical protein